MRLEHCPGQGLNINIGLFHLDITIEICQILRLHLHTPQHRHQPQHRELFICLVHVIVDRQLVLEFDADALDALGIRDDLLVALGDLAVQLTDYEDGVLEKAKVADLVGDPVST